MLKNLMDIPNRNRDLSSNPSTIFRWMACLTCMFLVALASGTCVAQDAEEADKAARKKISKLRVEFLRTLKKMKLAYAKTKDADERKQLTNDRRKLELDTVKEVTVALKDLSSDKLKLSTLGWYLDQKVKGDALAMVIDSVDEPMTKSKYAAELSSSLATMKTPSEKAIKIARMIAESATRKESKGISRMALAEMLTKVEKGKPEISEEIDSLFNEVIEEYGRVRFDGTTLGTLAKSKTGSQANCDWQDCAGHCRCRLGRR